MKDSLFYFVVEKFGCDRNQYVERGKKSFCIRFQTSACLIRRNCVDRQIVDKVQIAFSSSGEKVSEGNTPVLNGFRIGYATFRCPDIHTSECLYPTEIKQT